MPESAEQVDVAVVGYGPVGQAIAALLGARGHRVACFERYGEIYRLPRAVHLDHEVMRLLQRIGIADDASREMISFDEYRWFGADGETAMVLTPERPSLSGWEPDWLFFQPALEERLDARARMQAGVTVERGWTATRLEEGPQHATLELREFVEGSSGEPREGERTRTVSARYVVGADGANSTVREALGIDRKDLGFQERWFVVDVVPDDIEALGLPVACQWCDPVRPTTHVRSGVGHRRWEFMLLPGESADEFDETRAWELLAPWFGPQDGRLLRHAVYEFRSLVADRMRAGRTLIVGDAAHLTPPFLGQGLCAGLRDAANAAWKLDLVLRGAAPPELLDTIAAERQPQNEWIIAFAVELGKVLCELDPQKAAERDATLRAAGPPPALGLPPIAAGIVRAHDPLAGTLSLQGRLAAQGREARLDDLAGTGFTLIGAAGLRAALDPRTLASLEVLGATVVELGSDLQDVDGRTSEWLAGAHAAAVLVRPDLYVYGSAAKPAEVPQLVADLCSEVALNA